MTVVDSPGLGENRELEKMVTEQLPGAYGFIYVINSTHPAEMNVKDVCFYILI